MDIETQWANLKAINERMDALARQAVADRQKALFALVECQAALETASEWVAVNVSESEWAQVSAAIAKCREILEGV